MKTEFLFGIVCAEQLSNTDAVTGVMNRKINKTRNAENGVKE